MTIVRIAFKSLSSKKTAMSIVIGLVFIAPALSQVYKYKDKDGNIVYSSTPPPGVDAEKKKIEGDRPAPKAGASNSARPIGRTPDLKRPYRDIKVIMYMTERCDYCKRTNAFLNTLGITLIELDVQKDPEKRKEQLRKSGGQTSIPLLDIEGTIVHGYDPPQLQSVIEERRSALRPY